MTGQDDLVIEADTRSVRKIGPWLNELLAALPADEATVLSSRFELAVHEVAMNVIDHADLPPSARITFSAEVTDARVEIRITDPGEAFDLAGVRIPVPGVVQDRGYGLLLVRKLVDHVDYYRVDDGNRWILRISRARPAEPRPAGKERRP